jgi:hypothetical protein
MRFQNKVSLTTDEFETLANNIKANFSLWKVRHNKLVWFSL